MKNTFINKVTAERKILSVVNVHTFGNRQLAGLTASSINSWSQKVTSTSIEKIVASLRTLGELCQRLSDRSQESFGTIDTSVMEKIDDELIVLRTLFSKADLAART